MLTSIHQKIMPVSNIKYSLEKVLNCNMSQQFITLVVRRKEKFIKAIAKWRTDATKIKTEVECETEEVTVHT